MGRRERYGGVSGGDGEDGEISPVNLLTWVVYGVLLLSFLLYMNQIYYFYLMDFYSI